MNSFSRASHAPLIGLEICDKTGEALVWVGHSRPSIRDRINSRIRERAAEGRLAEYRYHEDPLEGLEYLGEADISLIVFDHHHALAHIESKGAHHWTLYESMRDHGLIHPPFIVSWYDVPKAERMRRFFSQHASAEVWNMLEADAMARYHIERGAHDVTIQEFDMRGEMIQERPPPALAG